MTDQEQTQEAQIDSVTAEHIGSLVDALYADEPSDEPEEAESADEGDSPDEASVEDVEGDELEADDDDAGEEEDTDEPEAAISEEDRLTLKRAGFSEERIDKMSPDLASGLAEDARESKRSADREYQEYLAQKNSKADTDETERHEAGEEPHPSQSNLQDLAALSQPFADDLGVEPEQLAKFAEAIANHARSPIQEQLNQLSALNEQAVSAAEEALVDSAVSRLSGDFPQLRSSESLSSIVGDAVAFLQSKNGPKEGSYVERLSAAMRKYATAEFIDEKVKQEVARKDKQRQRGRQRAKGQPTSAAKRGGDHSDPESAFRAEAAKLMDQAGM